MIDLIIFVTAQVHGDMDQGNTWQGDVSDANRVSMIVASKTVMLYNNAICRQCYVLR